MNSVEGAGHLVLLKETDASPSAFADGTAVAFSEIKGRIRKSPLKHLFGYRRVTLRTSSLELLSKPLFTAVLVRLLSRGDCYLEDMEGRSRRVTPARLLGLAAGLFWDTMDLRRFLPSLRRELTELASRPSLPRGHALDASGFPLYLRTDVSYGIKSGGSVGHIAGVLNNLDAFFAMPSFVTTDRIPTVRDDIPTTIFRPTSRFKDFREVSDLYFNRTLFGMIKLSLAGRKPAFIYQRYSLNNFTGAKLARELSVPLVLEYNGSEIWIARNWGTPLKYEEVSERIELVDMAIADLIVVVSRPMKDELAKRGIDPAKILVNPNGVDTARYSPQVDGSEVRRKLGLEGKTVVGFIGTFGPWHGAEVLAEAFGKLIAARPSLAGNVRLLMIGDGQKLPQVQEAIARHDIGKLCVLTGLIPQKEGPAHLAACDVLASPHVPNSDGTPFFGSPTKLFEYMAMGKGIVASDLDQIGEILRHDSTAWMVKPGDPDALAKGLSALIEDKALRDRLGSASREEAIAKYTWREHTRKIVEGLRERL